MLESIIAIVVVVLIGAGFLAYRYRSERGIESGITSFRRELRALAPREEQDAAPPDDDPEPDTEG